MEIVSNAKSDMQKFILYTHIYTLYIHAHYMRKLGLTTLPPSCADCREIWEPQPPRIFKASPGL